MAARKKSRAGRPRSEEARTAILVATIAEIRAVGYDALAMEAIAARAGVGKATVYRWWSSKELVVIEAIGQIVRAIPAPDTGSVQEDVFALIRATVGMYQDPATTGLLSGLVAAMARSEGVAGAMRSGFVGVWREAMREVMRRGMARGELPVGLDLEATIDMMAGPLFYRFLMIGKPIDDRFARTVVRTILNGIARVRGPAPRAQSTPKRRR